MYVLTGNLCSCDEGEPGAPETAPSGAGSWVRVRSGQGGRLQQVLRVLDDEFERHGARPRTVEVEIVAIGAILLLYFG